LNNSDVIAALSLFLTGAIFLAQTNGDLIRLKFKQSEMTIGAVLLGCIIVLVNSAVYERWGIQPYFSIGKIYLTPSEWALILFLCLFVFIITRVFTDKIFRPDFKLIIKLSHKYKAENQYAKCWNLIEQSLILPKNNEFLQQLDLEFFSDDIFLQKTASERPYLLTQYASQNKYSRLNYGQEIYNMLFGLFSSTNNPVFSEIEAFRQDELTGEILKDLMFLDKDDLCSYNVIKEFPDAWPILKWFVNMLGDKPTSLKEDIQHFLRFISKPDDMFNSVIYSRDEVDILLKRDPIFNALKLFRLGLTSHLYTNEKRDEMIDRVLLVFYSAWEFILDRTKLKNNEVALNNDSFTINEYLLKYQFESYLIVAMVQAKISEAENGHEMNEWTIKQLFAKLDGLLGNNEQVSMDSKQYYLEEVFDLFFETDDYCSTDDTIEMFRKMILIYINASLDHSPYGDIQLITEAYQQAFDDYDFVPYQRDEQLVRRFYIELLPHTADHEYNIRGTIGR
jgi:hypothetical protein